MVLFDIRNDDSHAGYIAAVNCGLDSQPDNPYVAKYGYVCSDQWWRHFDRGNLPVKVETGKVTFVGLRHQEWGEEEDIVEFLCDDKSITYDRVDHWAVHPINVGDHVRITSTVVELHAPTETVVYHIDIRAEWLTKAIEHQ